MKGEEEGHSVLTAIHFTETVVTVIKHTCYLPPGQKGRVDHLPRSWTAGLLSCVRPASYQSELLSHNYRVRRVLWWTLNPIFCIRSYCLIPGCSVSTYDGVLFCKGIHACKPSSCLCCKLKATERLWIELVDPVSVATDELKATERLQVELVNPVSVAIVMNKRLQQDYK